MYIVKIFTVFVFLSAFAVAASAQKSNPCAGKAEYVHRNQIDAPAIRLSGVKGRAVDSQGQAVQGICVALFTEKDHRLVTQTVADDNGYFKFRNVPNGKYRLVGRVSNDYFCPVNVRVQTKKDSRRRLILHMRPPAIDECSYGDTK